MVEVHQEMRPADLPIFKRYSIEELARRLLVGEAYIVRLKNSSDMTDIRPGFKRKAAKALNEPESTLFTVAGSDGGAG